jgi:hypothetical protein
MKPFILDNANEAIKKLLNYKNKISNYWVAWDSNPELIK